MKTWLSFEWLTELTCGVELKDVSLLAVGVWSLVRAMNEEMLFIPIEVVDNTFI